MKNMRGFTIFLAVLIGSLALAVGLAIYDLSVRELQLSGVWEQSQYAIYAADTGAECALYWDSKFNSVVSADADGSAFAASSTSNGIATLNQTYCNSQDIVAGNATTYNPVWQINTPVAPTATAATTTFQISIGATIADPCVIVTVAKYTSNNLQHTTITADGYNSCNTSAPTRYQRTLQLRY